MLGDMAASTEDIAVEILRSLKAEQERAQTLLQCRTYETILKEVAERRGYTADAVRPADRYLKTNHLIKGAQRQDGFAALPSEQGLAYLGTHAANLKADQKSRLEVRQRWYPIVISLIGLFVLVFGWRACSH